jgi:hypothetical protein
VKRHGCEALRRLSRRRSGSYNHLFLASNVRVRLLRHSLIKMTQGAAMSAPGPVKREDETEDVYELSSSSTNSDDPRDGEEVGKRGSPPGSPWGGGFLQKKQKLEPVDDLRLNAWRYEDLENQAQRDLNIGHEGKVASPVALPFFPQPSLEESAGTRANCKQFWKAGDYDGQSAAEVTQAGEYSDDLKG